VGEMGLNEQTIERFLNIKKVNGQSAKTIENQGYILEDLNEFLEGKPFKEATEDDILSYVSSNPSLSPSSRNTYKMVIKGFYRTIYGLPRSHYPDQVRNLNGGNSKRKIPIRPEDIITQEDIAHLLRYGSNFRNQAIVVTLFESAARRQEFLDINIEHLKFDNKGIVLVISGKTGGRRIRLIESVPYIQKWLETIRGRTRKKGRYGQR